VGEIGFTKSLIYMVSACSWFSKGILIVLLLLSIFSWAIIFLKYRFYRKMEREGKKLVRHVRSIVKLDADGIRRLRIGLQGNPIAGLVDETGKELVMALSSEGQSIDDTLISSIRVKLDGYITDVMSRESAYIDFLATTSTVSPFLGLLGTVMGITEAFWNIGMKGSATILVLAPGLAESLITTIAGLTVAIPAAVGYNYFVGKMRRLDGMMTSLASDIIALLSRNSK